MAFIDDFKTWLDSILQNDPGTKLRGDVLNAGLDSNLADKMLWLDQGEIASGTDLSFDNPIGKVYPDWNASGLSGNITLNSANAVIGGKSYLKHADLTAFADPAEVINPTHINYVDSSDNYFEFICVSVSPFQVWVNTLGPSGSVGTTSQDIKPKTANTTSLKTLDTTSVIDFPDGCLIVVESNGIYRLDRDASDTESLPEIVAPTTGSGRWFQDTDLTVFIADNNTLRGNVSGSSNPVKNLTATQVRGMLGIQEYEKMWIDEGLMVPRGTNGPERITIDHDSNTSGSYLAFDPTTEEAAGFQIALPNNYKAGTSIKVKVYWDCAAGGSGTVVWGISATALDNDSSWTNGFGAEVTITDTVLAVGDNHISPASAAITISGSPAKDIIVKVKIALKTSGSLAVDAHLRGIQVQYEVNETKESAW